MKPAIAVAKAVPPRRRPLDTRPSAVAAAQHGRLVPGAPVNGAIGDGRRAGPRNPSADPAPESDSESDAFSKDGNTVEFHNGRLDVRFGRKVKTTRPHLLLAGELDLYTLRGPSVVLKVSINASGDVTGVEVLRSSGSDAVDQPCRVAVYDWWFEPTRDKKSGKPVADVIVFTIKWR